MQIGAGGLNNPPLEFGKSSQNKVFTQLFKQENAISLFQKKSEDVTSPNQSTDQQQQSSSTGQ
jgi:uncharacterized protein with von Willebrand factor type A (vWA) domain